MAIISPVLGFLTTNHLALLITPLQTSLAHPPISEAQQEFKGLAFSGIHSNLIVEESPDPPFLFGEGSGNETRGDLTLVSSPDPHKREGLVTG